MSVILLTNDLMVVSHVQGAAARCGAAVHVAANVDEAAAVVKMAKAQTVIADLAMPSLDVAELVAQCKTSAPAPRLVAFGPHVHEDRLEAARHAGCDAVMSRGQFFSQVDTVLHG